ncbi:RNA-binding cell elongation regulator Jag/EloR [Priestia taiwanensis]|uniref:RNA-binding protein KhpB n=1 Tax=Priestia taiwanensis TaxID=1347902 RepID=A0A917AWQ5_9BACI|nr:RNA-binding cell elongation regulator Jag/EloR [Priestia taiwanensis]MBM7364848.1 spoIIIJ-associated protein [Priestia taiwanensis]GGE83194.1 Jag protein [Priestia taiwanensis]
MKSITAKGKTVEDAVIFALEQLHTTREKVDITVMDEGKKGLFGLFGNRLAVVEVTVKKCPIEEAENYLLSVVRGMNVDVKVEKQINGKEVTFQLIGEDIAVLIGKRGTTLNSLQYMTQLVANRYATSYLQITVDAGSYREKRKQILANLAMKVANQVLRTKKEVALEPMPSYERKVIHHVLSKNKQIQTYSAGSEPHRHIVIAPA